MPGHERFPHRYVRAGEPYRLVGQAMACRCGAVVFAEGEHGSDCPSAMVERIADLAAERGANSDGGEYR